VLAVLHGDPRQRLSLRLAEEREQRRLRQLRDHVGKMILVHRWRQAVPRLALTERVQVGHDLLRDGILVLAQVLAELFDHSPLPSVCGCTIVRRWRCEWSAKGCHRPTPTVREATFPAARYAHG